jgi:hypothetical protein
MKKWRRVSFVTGCVIFISLLWAVGLEAGTSYQITYTSRYIWRGFDANPDNKPALQPSVTFNFGKSGLSLNLWESFSFENKEVNETDITLSYAFKTSKKYSLSVGFIHYGWYFAKGFTFKNNTSNEVTISAGLPEVFLSPNLSLFYDFSNGAGLYAQLAVGGRLKIAGDIGADISAILGYNGKQWVNESGFSNLSIGVNVPFKLGNVTVSPFVNVVFILMDAVNPGVNNEMYFGVSLLF